MRGPMPWPSAKAYSQTANGPCFKDAYGAGDCRPCHPRGEPWETDNPAALSLRSRAKWFRANRDDPADRHNPRPTHRPGLPGAGPVRRPALGHAKRVMATSLAAPVPLQAVPVAKKAPKSIILPILRGRIVAAKCNSVSRPSPYAASKTASMSNRQIPVTPSAMVPRGASGEAGLMGRPQVQGRRTWCENATWRSDCRLLQIGQMPQPNTGLAGSHPRLI